MQIILNPNVQIKSAGNCLYFFNEALAIEIELETEQLIPPLIDAFKTDDFIDKLGNLLGIQESSDLLKKLEEAHMTTSGERIKQRNFSVLEKKYECEIAATKLNPGDCLNSIYNLLYTSKYKNLFDEVFSISVIDYKHPIWKARNLRIDTSVIQDYGFSTALIQIKDHHGEQKFIYGFGTSIKGVKEATALAMLECLERIYTMNNIPMAIIHNTAFSDLEEATNPEEYNIFNDQQYNSPDFEFQPFFQNSKLDWVSAESLTKNKLILIPRQLLTSEGLDKNYVPLSSNGCAIHTCDKKALLSAIEEIIERDSLMISWYQMNALPVLLDGPEILEKNSIGKILIAIGFKITLLDGTSDLNIPVIIAILEDSQNNSVFTANAATGESAEHAVDRLCNEFFSLWRDYTLDEHFIFPKNTSGSLTTLSDHFEFYQGKRYIKERDFLKSEKSSKRSMEMNWQKFNSAEQKINHMVQLLSEKNLDVINVNCTSDLLKKMGLSAVKVIIPGTIPLFVGKELPLGIERLVSTKRLNHLPHPYC